MVGFKYVYLDTDLKKIRYFAIRFFEIDSPDSEKFNSTKFSYIYIYIYIYIYCLSLIRVGRVT